MIRAATVKDAKAIRGIYEHYILETVITFEEEPVSVEEMEDRIRRVTRSFPWLVYESDGKVIGYAYADRWKSRSAYRYAVESTIYVDPRYTGQGIGKQLYGSLIPELRLRSLHSVLGVIALPNPASIALHERMGFVKVAHFKEVGWKFNRWIDVGDWQLLLMPLKDDLQ